MMFRDSRIFQTNAKARPSNRDDYLCSRMYYAEYNFGGQHEHICMSINFNRRQTCIRLSRVLQIVTFDRVKPFSKKLFPVDDIHSIVNPWLWPTWMVALLQRSQRYAPN